MPEEFEKKKYDVEGKFDQISQFAWVGGRRPLPVGTCAGEDGGRACTGVSVSLLLAGEAAPTELASAERNGLLCVICKALRWGLASGRVDSALTHG